jgi:hypothetical protein
MPKTKKRKRKPITPDVDLGLLDLIDLDRGAEHYGIEKGWLRMLARPGESDHKHLFVPLYILHIHTSV